MRKPKEVSGAAVELRRRNGAQRFLGFECGAHHLEVRDVERALLLLAGAFEPALDDRQVGEEAFGGEGVEVAGRVGGMVERGIGEIAQHQAKHILFADLLQRLAGEALEFGAVLAGDVAEDDLGVGGLFGREDGAEAVDPLIGHLDGAEVHLAAEARRDVEPGEGVEHRGLAGPCETHQSDAHDRNLGKRGRERQSMRRGDSIPFVRVGFRIAP